MPPKNVTNYLYLRAGAKNGGQIGQFLTKFRVAGKKWGANLFFTIFNHFLIFLR